MVLKMPLGTKRLENARIFRKIRKTTYRDLLPVNRCVNDVKWVCRGRIEAALPPTFTPHSLKTRRRMDFGLVAFFLVKNSSTDCKSFISE